MSREWRAAVQCTLIQYHSPLYHSEAALLEEDLAFYVHQLGQALMAERHPSLQPGAEWNRVREEEIIKVLFLTRT